MPTCFDDLLTVEPSIPARRLLWHALSVGSAWRDEPETHAARDKSGVYLFQVVSGSGQLQVAEQSWTLSPAPHVWLIDLRHPRAYIPEPGQRLVTSGVRFAGPALDMWQEILNDEEELVLTHTGDNTLIHEEQQRIMQMVTHRPPAYEWHVHECLTRILGCLLERRQMFDGAASTALPEPIQRVMDAVLSDPLQAWRAMDLAKVAGISYSGLRAMFRSTQNESLSEFLQRTRLEQAKQLLANDKLSVKEVAVRLKFSSEFYFSHWFRRHTASSPTRYRQTQLT